MAEISQLRQVLKWIHQRQEKCCTVVAQLLQGQLSPREAAHELFGARKEGKKETEEEIWERVTEEVRCFFLMLCCGNEVAADLVADLLGGSVKPKDAERKLLPEIEEQCGCLRASILDKPKIRCCCCEEKLEVAA